VFGIGSRCPPDEQDFAADLPAKLQALNTVASRTEGQPKIAQSW
jgi:hypothetical protein